MAARVYTIPPGASFLEALAAGLLAGIAGPPGELGNALVLVPTRRAARALADAFLRRNESRALILPRTFPIGDVDEEALVLSEFGAEAARDIPPAIAPARRRLLLAELVAQAAKARGSSMLHDKAFELADALAALLDEVQTERLDFTKLAGLVPEEYAEHWQLTLTFLKIVTEHWPEVLAAEGVIDPIDRRNRLLAAQAALWRKTPPAHAVIAAGSTGTVPATADLLAAIAELPRGIVALPGLDRTLDAASFAAIGTDHPQYALHRLLKRLGLTREQVLDWPGSRDGGALASRTRLFAAAMRPAETDPPEEERFGSDAIAGLARLDAPTPREEAGAVALALREALEVPGKTAALVTPDRGLARRVAVALRRFGIEVDDSAGIPLLETPPAVFLRLISRLLAEEVSPTSFLAVMKHPLAAAGMKRIAFLTRLRNFERTALRVPRPARGYAGLRLLLDAVRPPDMAPGERTALARWLAELESLARPFAAAARSAKPLAVFLQAHLEFAEALAATESEPGPLRLWAGDAGEALALALEEIRLALSGLDGGKHGFAQIEPRHYPAMFESFLAQQVVRPQRRAVPRLAIWGPLEARLQHADRIVLAGLNEGTWPPEVEPGPWMSRPMRERFGLPAPERRIGQTAHDFVQAAAAPEVILTRSERVEGTPTVPSRWLLRLDAILQRDGLSRSMAAKAPYVRWYEQIDDPGSPVPATAPRPCPPRAARPSRIGVTDFELLRDNPYALYAKRILNLRELDPLEATPDAAERGSMIHRALERFVKEFPGPLPDNAREKLIECGSAVFAPLRAHSDLYAFWWPRFLRIADWVVEYERERRPLLASSAAEVKGELELEISGRKFTLVGKADRVDRLKTGALILIDYKTGSVPSAKQVSTGKATQLLLEAAMALQGAFPGIKADSIAEIAYWHLTGGRDPGKSTRLTGSIEELAGKALDSLIRHVAAYDDPGRPYLAALRHPPFLDDPYLHLARLKEWSDL
jgi:ATP-dependent helicase/nuclease subunit B